MPQQTTQQMRTVMERVVRSSNQVQLEALVEPGTAEALVRQWLVGIVGREISVRVVFARSNKRGVMHHMC